MFFSAELYRPRLFGVHHRIVKAERKEHGLLALPFLFEGFQYLAFDPVAFD